MKKATLYTKVGKPLLDKTLSLAGLIVLAPVYAGISAAIKIDDPGPVLFTQKRVGKDKESFELHKFRSMKMSTPHDVPTHMLDNPDQYITRVGKFLRKSSLDELPQIWDIFRGKMSIIGPRPALWNQDDLVEERDKYGANNVMPGLTGWAQINGRDELEIPVKAIMDGEYVRKLQLGSFQGFLMDLKCFFGSFSSVLGAKGIVEGNTRFTLSVDGDNFGKTPFSVLISVYNRECPAYFEAALKSVLDNQTIKPDEIVLICDGPLTDDLDAVIDCFQNNYPEIIHVYRSDKNMGLGRALNWGLTKCENELVARVDSDDICDPNRFKVQISYLEKNKDIVAVGSNIDEFVEVPENPIGKKTMPTKNTDIINMSKYRNPINHMTVMFRKSAIEAVGSYLPLPFLEDYYLWLRLIANGYELSNLNEVLVHARVGNGMVDRRGNRNYISGWDVLSKYKLQHGIINIGEYWLNTLAVRAFVYAPRNVKEKFYSIFLRD